VADETGDMALSGIYFVMLMASRLGDGLRQLHMVRYLNICFGSLHSPLTKHRTQQGS